MDLIGTLLLFNEVILTKIFGALMRPLESTKQASRKDLHGIENEGYCQDIPPNSNNMEIISVIEQQDIQTSK